jgi:hypothetical protein
MCVCCRDVEEALEVLDCMAEVDDAAHTTDIEIDSEPVGEWDEYNRVGAHT